MSNGDEAETRYARSGPVHIAYQVIVGARIAALAGAGEVFVSNTVRDLVAGSGLKFRERSVHELKGIPGAWPLYSVEKD